MVPARELFDLGLQLMDSCSEGGHDEYVATRYRDGLIIATLISCPLRIRNLEMIRIGRHLVFDGNGYELRFSEEETKMWQPHRTAIPAELTAYIDRYLEQHRPTLLKGAAKRGSDPDAGGALWVNRWGKRFSQAGIRVQIEQRTKGGVRGTDMATTVQALRRHGAGRSRA